MENSELFRMLSEQTSSRLDKLESRMNDQFERFDAKLDRLFSERNAICIAHNERIDEISSNLSVLQGRQEQNEEQSKRRLTIVGFLIALFSTLFNGFLAFLLNKK